MRPIGDPFVALGPSGVAVRDRTKHLTPEDEKVLRLAGEHLGHLAADAAPAGYTKASPFATLLVGNRLLSLPGSQKEVRQFALDTRDGELAYDAGDALGVWPANGAPLVAEWLALTGLDPDEPVDLGDGTPLPLEEALRTRLDIARISTDLQTGVAPFVGFLEHRRARGHTGPNSRDQRNKVYVQDRMRENGARLWQWLQDGAHFSVCGDAGRMAKDVDQALQGIAATHGGLAPDEAAAYVRRPSADKRYVRDVY